ncbi:MAG: MFS transporter [Janthinobacterium lividum]
MAEESPKGLKPLNWLNFFAADVSEGVGPFLAVYLAINLHWKPGQVGIAIAAMQFAMVFAQSPAGLLVDNTGYKRIPIIVASLTMGVTAFLMTLFHSFPFIVGSQIMMGLAGSFYLPTLVALAVVIAAKGNFDHTISKNQSFNHAGNLTAAIFIGVVAKFTKNEGIFYCLMALSILCAISALSIPQKAITQSVENNPEENTTKKGAFKEIFSNKAFLIFLLLTVIFYFSNGAMLPLVAQEIAKAKPETSTLYLSACIVIAQLTMVPTVYICGKQAGKGRKKLLVIAFILLIIRGILYSFTDKTWYLLAFEVLDGMAAGIFSVTAIMVVDDLMGNSGRASFAQGLLASGLSLGSFLSNLVAGLIVDVAGFKIGFIFLSALALGAMLLLWKAMPETLKKDQ